MHFHGCNGTQERTGYGIKKNRNYEIKTSVEGEKDMLKTLMKNVMV